MGKQLTQIGGTPGEDNTEGKICKFNKYSLAKRHLEGLVFFLLQKECINVKKRKRRTHAQFVEELREINASIVVLSQFQKTTEKVDCKCNVCGHKWSATPDNLLHGKGCMKCRNVYLGDIKRKSTAKFIDEMKTINESIEICGTYTGAHNKIQCRCKIHNNIFESSPTHLLTGETGCQQCAKLKHKKIAQHTHENFCERMQLKNPDILIIGEYDGVVNKVEVQCVRCKHIWNPVAGSLLSGFGCPHCNISKGEKAIETFLKNNHIQYVAQKKFSELRGTGGNPLSYDFYLPTFNLLIEYQGQFHDGTASIQTNSAFQIQVIHDNLKAEYASNNGYKLLCVWYYDYDNIESILENYLNLQNPVTITA